MVFCFLLENLITEMKVAVAVLLLAAALRVYGLPNGPPSQACANIFPVGHTGSIPNAVANPTDLASSPYQLDLSPFGSPSSLSYEPGMTYQSEWPPCL